MVLLRIFSFLMVILILPDLYIYFRYVRPSGVGRWLRVGYWFPALLLILGVVYFSVFHDFYPESMRYLSYFILVFLCLCIPKMVFAPVTLCMRPLSRSLHRRLYEEYLGVFCGLAVLLWLVYGATIGRQRFIVREVDVEFESLPEAFDGYRIVHISDIHSGSWNNTDAMARAVDICNSQNADMIVFTGDLVNNLSEEIDAFMPVLSRLSAPDGVYSVLGNHDYSMYIKWSNQADRWDDIRSLVEKERAMGWRVLNNEHEVIRRGGDSIVVAGVENWGKPPFPQRGDLRRALGGTEGSFQLLLSHDPSHWRMKVLPETDVELMLAGHTHEMQFSIFGFSPAVFVYPEHNGLYSEGERRLFVNIGLGYVMFPMRLGAWPEISVLTLKRKVFD